MRDAHAIARLLSAQLFDVCQRTGSVRMRECNKHISWEGSIGRRSCKRKIEKKKNTLVAQVVCLQMLDFETSAEFSNSIQNILVRKYFLPKTQREPFLTMFYTTNCVARDNIGVHARPARGSQLV